MDHDALFKMLLKTPEILRGFFQEFVPQVWQFLDFTALEFLDKERHTIQGRKRTGDILVKTRFRGKDAAFLIHLEHQAQPDPELPLRMLEYVALDLREFHLPVYPIAVLSHAEAGAKEISPLQMDFPNKRVLQFDFDVIDLQRMKAEDHIDRRNPAALALAARMRFNAKHRLRLTLRFFLNLTATRVEKKVKELAIGFFSAYQPLSREEVLQLEMELGKLKPDTARQNIMELTNPFIELGKLRGREEGLQEGRQQGEIELVLRLLTRRLGTLSVSQEKAVRKLDLAQIEALGEALLDFHSRTDLTHWLRENSSPGTRG